MSANSIRRIERAQQYFDRGSIVFVILSLLLAGATLALGA